MERRDAHRLSPLDVTLLGQDGKEFKAHRNVLSEASPFFEKLLQSDMKENKEGVIRLELLTESLLQDILEFIYSGNIQISSEENAKDVITAADYLFLPNLKKIAGRFLEYNMTTSNCISTYHFAEIYRCDELVAKAKTFIESNFASVARSAEFLDLTSQEVEEWISSDEIVINTEEDIFIIILRWIAKERKFRTRKFEELFRHVRLIFASRDFILKELVTNDFVKQNESCKNRVMQALKWFDGSKSCDPPSPKSPRKVFEAHVLVAYGSNSVACYLPGEDKWYQLPENRARESTEIIAHEGKLFAITERLHKAECYEPLRNKWTSSALTNILEFMEINRDAVGGDCILAANGAIYAVVISINIGRQEYRTEFAKYNMASHSWQFLPCPFLAGKHSVCAVAFNKYVYVVGGYGGDFLTDQFEWNDAARFDTESSTWEQIATLQEARAEAFGAAANGKVYIAGGMKITIEPRERLSSCEVYNEMTNEWSFIACLTVPRASGNMVCVDGTLYVLGGITDRRSRRSAEPSLTVECYDPEKDRWHKKTTLPRLFSASERQLLKGGYSRACAAKLLKRVLTMESPRTRSVQHCSIA